MWLQLYTLKRLLKVFDDQCKKWSSVDVIKQNLNLNMDIIHGLTSCHFFQVQMQNKLYKDFFVLQKNIC